MPFFDVSQILVDNFFSQVKVFREISNKEIKTVGHRLRFSDNFQQLKFRGLFCWPGVFCWPDWKRFGPDSGHKAIFKAGTEQGKVRQWLCLACAIEWRISLVCVLLMMWCEWARKVKTRFMPLYQDICQATWWKVVCSLVMQYLSSGPQLLFDK